MRLTGRTFKLIAFKRVNVIEPFFAVARHSHPFGIGASGHFLGLICIFIDSMILKSNPYMPHKNCKWFPQHQVHVS